MLVLTRKLNEEIIISDNISISIVEISGDKVKLGINAPSAVKIFRKELIDVIKQTNLESSGTSVDAIKKLKDKLGEK